MGGNFQPTLKSHHLGGEFEARYFVSDKLSLGLGGRCTSKTYNENFGFPADRTRGKFMAIHAIGYYDFLQNEKFFLSGFINSGMYQFALVNPDELEMVKVEQEIDGVWYTGETAFAKVLQRKRFFQMTTGLDFSYKIAKITSDNVGIFLTSKAAYQNLIGKQCAFGANKFSGILLSVGVTIKGPTK